MRGKRVKAFRRWSVPHPGRKFGGIGRVLDEALANKLARSGVLTAREVEELRAAGYGIEGCATPVACPPIVAVSSRVPRTAEDRARVEAAQARRERRAARRLVAVRS